MPDRRIPRIRRPRPLPAPRSKRTHRKSLRWRSNTAPESGFEKTLILHIGRTWLGDSAYCDHKQMRKKSPRCRERNMRRNLGHGFAKNTNCGLRCASSLVSCRMVCCAQGSLTPTAAMSVPRMNHTATRLLDGRVLVTGGVSLTAGGQSLTESEIYDPATGSFSMTGSLHVGRRRHTATLLPDGRVLVVGGDGWTGFTGLRVVRG
jgi:hypothetical protein